MGKKWSASGYLEVGEFIFLKMHLIVYKKKKREYLLGWLI